MRYLIAISSLLLASCQAETHTHVLNNVIFEDQYEEIAKIEAQNIHLKISSIGGKNDVSVKAAKFLEPKNLKITVEGNCWSACASYFLPVADEIFFKNEPLIGFHWSTIMVYELGKRNADKSCTDKTYKLYEIEKQHLKIKNLNYGLWKETSNRLILKDFEVTDNSYSQCSYAILNFDNFEHAMWFPTSKQLQDLWGLKFKGAVCADDYEACTRTIDSMVPEGESVNVVVGDKVYQSFGTME